MTVINLKRPQFFLGHETNAVNVCVLSVFYSRPTSVANRTSSLLPAHCAAAVFAVFKRQLCLIDTPVNVAGSCCSLWMNHHHENPAERCNFSLQGDDESFFVGHLGHLEH